MKNEKKTKKGYFYNEQEEAVKKYLEANTDEERNELYNKILNPAFTKMIESIIRRYKLFPPDEDYEETFNDTMSFLMTRINYFNPEKNFKAYSYYGTVCKNYLIYKINQIKKRNERTESYDIMVENNVRNDDGYEMFVNDINFSSQSNSKAELSFLTTLINRITERINGYLDKSEEYKLKPNEIKVGKALIELFTHFEEIFLDTLGSRKFNKSSILLFLKETTNLTTPEIRNGMKRYKKEYYMLKQKLVSE